VARQALLIGVSRFDDPRLSALNAPAQDVTALAEVLRDPARGGFEEVTLSLDEDYLTVRDRLAALFESRDPDDTVLLYYSGHGVLRRGNRLFLATPGSDLDRPQARSIAAAEIRDLMDQSRAERQLLILDCCHSGAFGEHAKGAVAQAVTDNTFAGGGSGRYVLTASDSQQFAWDGGELKEGDVETRRLSSFTSWLVDGIGTAQAAPDEADITLDALFRYVCRRARSEGAAATPQSYVDRATGEFVIARNPAATTEAEVDKQAASLASEDWTIRNAAADALGKLARRPGTRASAREALADRLAVERDFKVRGAILKALELRPEEEEPEASTRGPRLSSTAVPQFSDGEKAVLRDAGIPEEQWPQLQSSVVEHTQLVARAIFWGRAVVWGAWVMVVGDVGLLQEQFTKHTSDEVSTSIGLALTQIIIAVLVLVPTPWRISVASPSVSAEFAQLSQKLKIVRFKQFFKWSFNPAFDARRLRKAAIITLIAGGLTLIAAVIIASVDLQNLSTQSSSPQNFAPKQSFGPPLEFPGKTAPPNSLKK
jgi:uncharacterized caspase-like protein